MIHRLGIAALLACTAAIAAAEPATVVVSAGGEAIITTDDGHLAALSPVGFGPQWGWLGGARAPVEHAAGAAVTGRRFRGDSIGAAEIEAEYRYRIDDGDLVIDVTLSTDADAPLTFIGHTLTPGDLLAGGSLNAGEVAADIPLGRAAVDPIAAFALAKGERELRVVCDPPLGLSIDGGCRIQLVSERIAAGTPVEISLRLQRAGGFQLLDVEAADRPADLERWFAFRPRNVVEGGAIGMRDWLPDTAGNNGRPRIDGPDLVYPDGTRAVFWGTNVEYAACAPEAEVAAHKAAWFAKYGVNAVRLHKLTNPGWEGLGSEESAATYDPEKLARFDRFMAELRANGIVYGFSPIWDLKLFPGDRDRLVAYDELVAGRGRDTDTFGALWFADDIQQLHIDALVNLLDHRNPHTGLRYAEDPALLYVEIQNEHNAFFYRTLKALERLPTYRGIAAEKFTSWLRDRYGSEAGLIEAWGGADAINLYRGEARQEQSFADNSIVPVLNPWMLENHLQEPARRQRLLDTMRFCYEMQNAYYQKVEAALAAIGYDGPLVGSNWQAGTGAGHYANLLSDRQTGIIDRHNYMGGSGRVFVEKGADVKMVTMLDHPGSDILSTGAQQVEDRPFMLSEWQSIQPTPWTAADTTIIAAYGMGLQSWDVSFHFASNDEHGFTPGFYEGGRRKQFNNMVPMGFGLYPALSRMVLRGDVAAAEVFAVRALAPEQVFDDELPFTDEVLQEHDIKSFGGAVPPAALAVGRTVVRFTDEPADFTPPDLAAHREGDALVSTTGELAWHKPEDGRGWIAIDTAGTQGFAGFLPESGVELGDCTLSIDKPYAVVLLSAANPAGTIATDDRVLVTVQALTRQTGQRIVGGQLLAVGEPPILMEPVVVELTLARAGQPTVYVCDHDGLRTERTVPVTDGQVRLDTGRDRALYYEIVYRE